MADKVEPVNDNDDWNYVPEGWDSNKWKQDDCNITWLPEFTFDKSFLTDIPGDADDFFFFFLLFLNHDVLQSLVNEFCRKVWQYSLPWQFILE